MRGIIAIAWFVFQTSSVYADEWHHNQPSCGHQALGLGGAFTAIANDTSALCYNPAGLGFINSRNMTSSLTSYERKLERTYGVASTGKVDLTTSGVKGFIGGLTTNPRFLPKIPFAIVIDVPRAEEAHSSFNFDAPTINVKDAHLNQTSGVLDRVIMIGSAIKTTSDIAVGASIGIQNISTKFTQHTDALLIQEGQPPFLTAEGDHLTSDLWFALYQAGILHQVTSRLSIGASISYGFPFKQTQSLQVDASVGSLQSSTANDGSYTASSIKTYHYEVNSGFGYRHLPLKNRFGLAYKLTEDLRVSADGQHTIPPAIEYEPREGAF